MRYGRHLLAATLGASLTFGGLAVGVASIGPVAQAQDIGAGAMAVVDVDFLNVRQTPSLSGAIVTTLAFGDDVDVETGPVNADGYDWYRLQQGGSIIGWSVAGFLRAGDGEVGTPVVGWMYGDTVTVTSGALNVRATPSTSAAVLDVYEFGAVATVTGDAATADGFVWYPLDNLGWVAGQYLTGDNGIPDGTDDGSDDTDGGTVPSTEESWVYDDAVVVTVDALNVRATPSTSAEILDVYPFGTQVTVTGDATAAGGITWYPVDNLGWVSGEFLADGEGTAARVDDGEEASGTFVYGNVVVVSTDLLNVRSVPTLSGSILDVYPSGTEATITGDLTTGDGNTWYPVDNLGWVAGQYLTFVSSAAAEPSRSTDRSVAPSATVASSDSAAPSATASSSSSARPSATASSSSPARPSASSPASGASGSAAPSTAPEADGFADGDVVNVNAARLNVRAEASSTAEILEVVDLGTEFTVSGEPVEVNGATWYNVGTDDAPGWVVGTFLTAVEAGETEG